MSTQPTVADLAHRAMELNDLLNADMARQFIRNNNIRSTAKLETLVAEQLKDKSAEEIAEICKPVEGATRQANAKIKEVTKEKPAPKQKPAAKSADAKSDGKSTEKKFANKGREPREVKIVQAGPRGFRFGEVWCNSVRNGEGVAILESNRPKLIAHATELGVAASVIESNDPAKICKSLTLKMDKAAEKAAETATA